MDIFMYNHQNCPGERACHLLQLVYYYSNNKVCGGEGQGEKEKESYRREWREELGEKRER
jgi:hypothetical protein